MARKPGLPPLFGAPWEQEEDVESAIPSGERRVSSQEELNLWREAERASEQQMSHIIRRELYDAKLAGNEVRALLVEITRLYG